MKQTTRPPAQYVVAQGTQFRLVANEYDKNTYGQCNYASNRTLIRCKQIRSKEELAKNGGRCDEHVEHSKVLETNHRKEVMRCHAENDSKMQRRRFDPWIASNEFISDEDDYLQAVQSVPQGLPESANDNVFDDHPLRYAEYFTDKDILNIKLDLVEKDIADLEEFKQLVTSQAQKEHELIENDEEDDRPTDMAQRRVFNAAARYARNDYLTLTTIDPVYNQCCVGPQMDDQLTIVHLVHSLLDKLDNFQPISIEKQCQKPALHLTKFCIDHITLDRSQKLFDVCGACGITAIGGEDPKCSFHMKSHAIAANTDCPCSRCVVQPKQVNSPKERSTYALNTSDDDEPTLGNLSRIESMVSPMQQFSSPPVTPSTSNTPRRYHGPPAQLLRPPQMGPPPGISSASSASSSSTPQVPYPPTKPVVPRAVSSPTPSLTPQQLHEQYVARLQEEELRSQTCARVRPVDPTQFGKKKQQRQGMSRGGGSLGGSSPSTGYLLQQQQQKKMPSIISGSSALFNTSPGKMNFPGWRNQPVTTTNPRSRQQHPSQMRYPVHPNRTQQHRQHQQPHQPKMIPLERAQEPRNPDELVEDVCDSPPMKYPGPEPTRRGVPYYKNAYRRTELPTRHSLQSSPLTPSTSTSSSHLLGPPASPQQSPQLYRPHSSRLPMPPHRAIAAGLNPAEVGQPRQTYRIGNPGQHRIPLQGHPPQHISPPNQQQQQMGSLMSMSLNPNTRRPQTQQAPLRMMAGGTGQRPGPNTVTTSYIVGGQSSYHGSSQHYGSSSAGFTMSALDSARQDARFANINVKTFLAMGNKDLTTLTQEEIDMLAAGGAAPEKPTRKGQPPPQGSRPMAQESSQKGPQGIAGTASSKPAPKSSRAPVPDAVQQVVSSPSISAPPIVSSSDSESITTEALFRDTTTIITSKKRKFEETMEATPASESTVLPSEVPEACGEPAAKKQSVSEVPPATISPTKRVSVEKEKNERSKTPKISTAAKTTPPPSGRTPRAAAIAANHAIVHHQKPVTPSTSTASSTTSVPGQENPLNLLAELSAAAEEQEAMETPETKGNNKKAKKSSSPKASAPSTSTVAQRRSSTGKKISRGESDEHEEEL